MNKKSGMTVAVLVIAMGIMSIVLGTAVITGTNSLKKANADKYRSILSRVEEAASLYYEDNNEYPLYEDGGSYVEIKTETVENSLQNEIIEKGDYQPILYVLDTAKLGSANIDIGTTLGDTNVILGKKDVFLINKETGTVYYFAGLKINGTKVHSLD